jgi:hypothetical protein
MLTAIEVCAAVVAKYTALGYHMSMVCQPCGYVGVSLHLFTKDTKDSPTILASRYYTWPEDEQELRDLING